MGSLSRKLFVTLLVGATLTLLFAAFGAGASASTKVKGKVHACVIKKGEDKGLMRFSRSGKCKKGEKKLTWNKRGKRGKRGAAGPRGETGPAGGGSDQLTATVAALCSQVSTVTSQLNALQTVIAGLGLNGVLTGLGGALSIPALPSALPSFACP
jgi:hypothetical protein